jgi:serine/threonine protein phosphatase PrpC
LGYIQLTRDHKPELEDEYERIINSGGAVEQFMDNGKGLGPNRVWVKNEIFPGLAMSRSIGDYIASTVGVTCVPGI